MGPSAIGRSTLDKNLAALERTNPAAAEQLRRATARTDVQWLETRDAGAPSAVVTAPHRQTAISLASRLHPLREADRIAARIDVQTHGLIVIVGFGLGYHLRSAMRAIAGKAALLIYEPDAGLLRAVLERLDVSDILVADRLALLVGEDGRGPSLTPIMERRAAMVTQGLQLITHPPTRQLDGPSVQAFCETLKQAVDYCRTVVATTLVNARITVRNLTQNAAWYAAGNTINELKNTAVGKPAVLVAAGPSLAKNIDLLAKPGVRDRVIIIAAQTVLKLLLDYNIRPHFVTALDYHEISRRFYDGLPDLPDVTLIAEPKANPLILDHYPGPVRILQHKFLDTLLNKDATDAPHAGLPAGSTVAHLSLYLAQYLGCDPIILTGQDLGFSDGLYYCPGTAIHQVLAPELGIFNTLETMEWKRIARHKHHLNKRDDIHGRPIYADQQMLTYLSQFERDFAEAEQTIIDATEGGLPKRNTQIMPLGQALESYAPGRTHRGAPASADGRAGDPTLSQTPSGPGEPGRLAERSLAGAPPQSIITLPVPTGQLNEARLRTARERVQQRIKQTQQLQQTTQQTLKLLHQMLHDQGDHHRMGRHFKQLERQRKRVATLDDAFKLVDAVNQVGAFNRLRADRAIGAAASELDAHDRQKRQLERDITNLSWLDDACAETLDLLDGAADRMVGPEARGRSPRKIMTSSPEGAGGEAFAVALVPVFDERAVTQTFKGSPIIARTLDRLLRCENVEAVVVLHDATLGEQAIAKLKQLAGDRVRVVQTQAALSDKGRRRRLAARAFAPTAWRSNLGGTTCYDELLAPEAMLEAMDTVGASAGLLVGPDWIVVDYALCDAVISRHARDPKRLPLVFTQAAVGLCGCVVGRGLMHELAENGSSIGALVEYSVQRPQGDPIAKDLCVQIEPILRDLGNHARFTCDAGRWRTLLEAASEDADLPAAELAERLQQVADTDRPPQHATLELTARRLPTGPIVPQGHLRIDRQDMPLATARRLIDDLAATPDITLTLGGLGDPLLHADWEAVADAAKAAGIRAVHLETDLLADRDVIDRLARSAVDVVSVRLNADTAETYAKLMGIDRFDHVLHNIEHLLEHQRDRPHEGPTWIVPRLIKVAENVAEIEGFFDRWTYFCQAAVIDSPSTGCGKIPNAALVDMAGGKRQPCRQLGKRMSILSDGRRALCDQDWLGEGTQEVADVRAMHAAGRWAEHPLCANCSAWHRP
ncbi:MAG: 6-hydroxymethylpterin diphosphokinase MptE-like protein [Phycisphaeraceae bacterium]